MSNAYVSYNNIVSSLGFSSETVVENIRNEVSGLKLIDNPQVLPEPFYSALIDSKELENKFQKLQPNKEYTRLEKMMISSLNEVIQKSNIPLNKRVGLIISTTKGNVDALDKNNLFSKERAHLSELGKSIKEFFGFKNEAIVVSNACVSGILAVAIAKRYLQQNTYDHVFIVSGDVVTEFILSGFNSFQALSHKPCKPYDKNRTGINIGEVAASALITNNSENLSKEAVEILGEGSCNDANHISGPSRTGEGLYRSIKSALEQAKLSARDVDFISAHGTATLFNDEMEAIAINRLDLQDTPLNSLKGYFGHTLGASGLLETIIGMHSLNNNTLYASKGFETLGVSKPINVIKKTTSKELNTFLKTASGFGGCNTAIIFKKLTH
ncbi:beta-ketoacyl-[acyl-carrier-protein] synthase family protein [Xanthomarina sp. F2636L]|uniref:beta-ketoacyl-[acyl-carrier-protein] synthase family protein n=1 Tax=Xanthomarina sp. F2636L TaxID=2996018 RepID=UPI00225DEFD5|nr:beta-ketoacyl synthase N-terminal-like domain-containing protein [Xanthomarina sp. F2636L]MCX7551462.1 beta-ketoacyl synthase N-terminal-like domain-containing protein [Xanthomarina sp. F2636L]